MSTATVEEKQTPDFKNAISHQESLNLFLRYLAKFERAFCKAMYDGEDFTMRLEVRGNAKELLRVRLYRDESEQPRGAQYRIDKKRASDNSNG